MACLAADAIDELIVNELSAAKLRHAFRHLTRHKISDRWRGRVWLLVECGSHRKLERGAASGSLHRLVRPIQAAEAKA